MNADETFSLYLNGDHTWNAWAKTLLREQQTLRDAGKWEQASGPTKEQEEWHVRARADLGRMQTIDDRSTIDFSDFVFPGTIVSVGARFRVPVSFSGAVFHEPIDFGGARFSSDVDFSGATFRGSATFDHAEFAGDARFTKSSFQDASFSNTNFRDGIFNETNFDGDVSFNNSKWRSGDFQKAVFRKDCSFLSLHSKLNMWFLYCRFDETASFSGSHWESMVGFQHASFKNRARFLNATFDGIAVFFQTDFHEGATFLQSKFDGEAHFNNALFRGEVLFNQAQFNGPAYFVDTAWFGQAAFTGAKSQITFDLTGSVFHCVPNFVETDFHREPRLDNISVRPRWRDNWLGPEWRDSDRGLFSGVNGDGPTKFRELKRYAIAAEDQVRELEFHAQEIRSARFVSDWPVPWKSSHLRGVGRFYFGYLYGLSSNFGRSFARPLVAWVALTCLSAFYYAGQMPSPERYGAPYAGTFVADIVPSIRRGADTVTRGGPCVTTAGHMSAPNVSDAGTEAIQLALRTALVLPTGDQSTAVRRTYSCLYGLVGLGANAPPAVPVTVSSFSIVQAVLSAVMIFLFGLALRNMLKLK